MRFTLTRVERNSTCTIGKLTSDQSDWWCWTLEDPVRPVGVKIPGSTAIPAGTYRVQITYSPRFRVEMPMLVNVPNFSGVRIHTGNNSDDTAGCVLVGLDRDGDSIGRSRLAYQDLFAQIKDELESGGEVLIEVVNQYESV